MKIIITRAKPKYTVYVTNCKSQYTSKEKRRKEGSAIVNIWSIERNNIKIATMTFIRKWYNMCFLNVDDYCTTTLRNLNTQRSPFCELRFVRTKTSHVG